MEFNDNMLKIFYTVLKLRSTGRFFSTRNLKPKAYLRNYAFERFAPHDSSAVQITPNWNPQLLINATSLKQWIKFLAREKKKSVSLLGTGWRQASTFVKTYGSGFNVFKNVKSAQKKFLKQTAPKRSKLSYVARFQRLGDSYSVFSETNWAQRLFFWRHRRLANSWLSKRHFFLSLKTLKRAALVLEAREARVKIKQRTYTHTVKKAISQMLVPMSGGYFGDFKKRKQLKTNYFRTGAGRAFFLQISKNFGKHRAILSFLSAFSNAQKRAKVGRKSKAFNVGPTLKVRSSVLFPVRQKSAAKILRGESMSFFRNKAWRERKFMPLVPALNFFDELHFEPKRLVNSTRVNFFGTQFRSWRFIPRKPFLPRPVYLRGLIKQRLKKKNWARLLRKPRPVELKTLKRRKLFFLVKKLCTAADAKVRPRLNRQNTRVANKSIKKQVLKLFKKHIKLVRKIKRNKFKSRIKKNKNRILTHLKHRRLSKKVKRAKKAKRRANFRKNFPGYRYYCLGQKKKLWLFRQSWRFSLKQNRLRKLRSKAFLPWAQPAIFISAKNGKLFDSSKTAVHSDFAAASALYPASLRQAFKFFDSEQNFNSQKILPQDGIAVPGKRDTGIRMQKNFNSIFQPGKTISEDFPLFAIDLYKVFVHNVTEKHSLPLVSPRTGFPVYRNPQVLEYKSLLVKYTNLLDVFYKEFAAHKHHKSTTQRPISRLVNHFENVTGVLLRAEARTKSKNLDAVHLWFKSGYTDDLDFYRTKKSLFHMRVIVSRLFQWLYDRPATSFLLGNKLRHISLVKGFCPDKQFVYKKSVKWAVNTRRHRQNV